MADTAEQLKAVVGGRLQIAETQAARIPPQFLLQHQVSPDTIRAFSTRSIIGSFCIFLLAVGAFIIFGEQHASPERVGWLIDIGKSLYLPVVTFVLGYFFGKAG